MSLSQIIKVGLFFTVKERKDLAHSKGGKSSHQVHYCKTRTEG